jgi:hypothetical protein
LLGHPMGAREMRFPSAPSALRFCVWVDVQDEPRNLFPIGAISFRVEQTHVSDEMLLVIAGQCGIVGSGVGNRRIKWGRRHRAVRCLGQSRGRNLGC